MERGDGGTALASRSVFSTFERSEMGFGAGPGCGFAIGRASRWQTSSDPEETVAFTRAMRAAWTEDAAQFARYGSGSLLPARRGAHERDRAATRGRFRISARRLRRGRMKGVRRRRDM